MMMMNPTTPTELLPAPAPNGDGSATVPAPVVAAAAAEVNAELLKKMAAIEVLGKHIQSTERKRDKQETVD